MAFCKNMSAVSNRLRSHMRERHRAALALATALLTDATIASAQKTSTDDKGFAVTKQHQQKQPADRAVWRSSLFGSGQPAF
jgi:hypothetical protein